MREIKLRGIHNDKIVYGTGVLYKDCKTWLIRCDDVNTPIATQITGYITQYTGLKDKNGTEIYEGDIIKHKLGVIKTVYFKNGAFMLSHLLSDLVIGDGWLLEWEVIGNIYENKDLLEESICLK